MIGGPSKYWVLPPEIMGPLQEEFQFDYDPIPFSAGFVEFDGFADVPEGKKSVWLNPLFGRGITKWVRWAIKQAEHGKLVVVILPLDGWVNLFFEQIFGVGRSARGTLSGEIRPIGSHDWLNPETGAKRRSSRPSFLFILRPREQILTGAKP
ncbi:MAG: hypothetical protein JRM77_06910 [Nitrososphaerota archaeon]|nr:hypothetical protein [Nitrososphaerota archaeon]